ncbi:MAG: aldolase/citrate lyase family protein [Candidatus Hydrogenedentota bacterium]
MNRQQLKDSCKNRRICWGTVLFEYAVPHTVRTFARAGYEWLWIDLEHNALALDTVLELGRTAQDVGIATIVRVPQSEYAYIARTLDTGVDGIMIPRVETPEQMRHIVDCAKYPPIGKRGFGIRPKAFGKQSMSIRERVADQNTTRLLCIQFESPDAVTNAEAIIDAAEGQLDAVFMGPADYQVAIGKLDEPDAPELDAAARRVSAICGERNIANGVPVATLSSARWWLDRGFTMFTFASDDMFLANTACEARVALSELERQFSESAGEES